MKVAKKNLKKKKQSQFFSLKNNITIMLTVTITIIIMVSIVEAFMFIYTKDGVRDIQRNLTSNFVSNVKIFDKDLAAKNYSNMINDFNELVDSDFQIKHILITDNNKKEIYKSLPNNSTYMYRSPQPASLKFTNIPNINLNEYKTVYLYRANVNVYLLMPKTSNLLFQDMTNFMKIFFSIIMLLCVLVSYKLAGSISKPLLTMEKTVSKIAEGDLSVRLEYTKYNEINRLVQAYNMMANALQRLYSSLEVKVQDRTKELKSAYAELQSTQAMMVHSEKMKSLGELVAGIMHEINNPINFIYGNMTHLGNYSNDLVEIIEKYTQYDESLKPDEKTEVSKLKEEIDYEFLKSDMPDLIKSCKEGAERAKNIIQDLKSFSRMEEVAITDVNLAHEIDMTLNILHNKLKNKTEIHKEIPEDLPTIEAFGGQLNQVFMNILDNAVGAIKEKGDIWIRIKPNKNDNKMVIEIEDNGSGMDEETARKVFNPFFTTKPVGQGTGLGMSITYKIIKNHQGDITVASKLGEGTKFTITLPMNIDRENMNTALASGGENG